MTTPIEIYRSADGQAQVEVRFEQETVWLSQAQMVELFGRNQSVISRHIRNAITEGEIDEKSNMQKMHIASADRSVTFYDLETIISVGYRIKSPQGVAFRRWATTRLKEYLLQGYTLDRKRLAQSAHQQRLCASGIQGLRWPARRDSGPHIRQRNSRYFINVPPLPRQATTKTGRPPLAAAIQP